VNHQAFIRILSSTYCLKLVIKFRIVIDTQKVENFLILYQIEMILRFAYNVVEF